jgi:hypothetical protein
LYRSQVSLCEAHHLLLISFLLESDIELISIFRRKFMIITATQYAVAAAVVLAVCIFSSVVE